MPPTQLTERALPPPASPRAVVVTVGRRGVIVGRWHRRGLSGFARLGLGFAAAPARRLGGGVGGLGGRGFGRRRLRRGYFRLGGGFLRAPALGLGFLRWPGLGDRRLFVEWALDHRRAVGLDWLIWRRRPLAAATATAAFLGTRLVGR